MSELHPVSGHRTESTADIIFVHGLGGHWRNTWATDPGRDETYWPTWLAQSVPSADIWSLEYEANRTQWRPGMSLIEQAQSFLELLKTKQFGTRPLLFVTHSLGGLLVKSVLRESYAARDDGAKRIASATRGVAFFATPNSGAQLASRFVQLLRLLGPLGEAYRVSSLVEELRANGPHLLGLNRWYRDNVSDPLNGLNIATKVYYETRPAGLGFLSIVDATSADPGINGVQPVPVSANHFGICKFDSHNDWLYENISQFLSGCAEINDGGDRRHEVSTIAGRSFAPKIIELAFEKMPQKLRVEIASNMIENSNLTVILTRSSGGSHE